MYRFQLLVTLTLSLLAVLRGQSPEDTRDTLIVTLPGPATTLGEPVWNSHSEPGFASARNGLMWKASLGANTVYLLGSIHLASRDLYPLPDHIERAFRTSSVLVVEVDLNRLDQSKFQGLLAANGLYPREDSLWNHVSPSTRKLVTIFCERQGLQAESFARMKPWLAAFATAFLPVRAMQPDWVPGVDKYFLDKASNGIRVEPLESAEYQLRLVSTMPERQQERSLRAAVKNAGQIGEDFTRLQTLWLAGDAEKLDSYLSSSMRDDPDYEKRVFADRNPRMAERAEKCLKNGERCFVVVGAGHMVGRDGIVRLLQDRGIQVKQVFPAE
jgi:uncharacterized protein YbaP (TraB family)